MSMRHEPHEGPAPVTTGFRDYLLAVLLVWSVLAGVWAAVAAFVCLLNACCGCG